MTSIRAYESHDKEALLDLSRRAWTPVFPQLKRSVPDFVYEAFWPHGWQARQMSDLSEVLDGEPENVDVALNGGQPVGWVCTRIHPQDNMGEIYVLVVDPDHQRRGVGRRLMEHANQRVADARMRMMMVETVGDPGHAPARHLYETHGFQRWPVARYFKDLQA